VPIPGTTKQSRLADNIGSVDIVLSAEEISHLSETAAQIPNSAERLPPASLAMIDR